MNAVAPNAANVTGPSRSSRNSGNNAQSQNYMNTVNMNQITSILRGVNDRSNGILPHQKHAINMARRVANGMGNVSRPRGSVVYHSTGSGKTLVAGLIALKYMERTPEPYVFVVTTAGNARQLKENLAKELASYAPSVMTSLARRQQHLVLPGETEYTRRLKKGIQVFSYVSLAAQLGLFEDPTKNSSSEAALEIRRTWKERGMVLILDEAHEVVKKLDKDLIAAQKKGETTSLVKLKKFIAKHARNPLLHVHALTATLGTSMKEIKNLMHLIKYPKSNMNSHLNVPMSIANMRDDHQIFAPVTKNNPTRIALHPVHYMYALQQIGKVKLSHFAKSKSVQTTKTTLAEYAKIWRGKERVLNNLLKVMNYIPVNQSKQTLAIANIFRSATNVSQYKLVEMGGKQYLTGPKMTQLVRNLMSMTGKHYVYVIDSTSVMLLAKLLESEGYKDVSVTYRGTDSMKNLDSWRRNPERNSSKARYYDRSTDTFKHFVTSTQQTPATELQKYMSGLDRGDSYTDDTRRRNRRGQNCKIIITTNKAYFGVNIHSLQHVHLLSPFPTRLKHQQAVGRGARAFGHTFANLNQVYESVHRRVQIHQYIATKPLKNWIDQHNKRFATGNMKALFKETGIGKQFIEALPYTVTSQRNTNVSGTRGIATIDELVYFHRKKNDLESALEQYINTIRAVNGRNARRNSRPNMR